MAQEQAKKKKELDLQHEVQAKVVSYITAAFGLVAGLAWNEAIKALIEFSFPLSRNTLVAKFLYASLVTIVVVGISTVLMKWQNRAE